MSESVFPDFQSTKFDECGNVDIPINVPTRFAPEGGLSKRELFAAMAMQGFAVDELSAPAYELLAYKAVKAADALLEALAKPEETKR